MILKGNPDTMSNLTRLDAVATAWFSRELENIDTTDYEELLPGNLARRYIPDVQGVPDWASSHTYRQYRKVGSAKMSGKNSDDAPRVTLTAAEFSRLIKRLENSYSWTADEIAAAAATRKPLDRLTVLAARSALDQEIDELLALGDLTKGIEGLLTLQEVDDSTTPISKTSGTAWAANAATDPDKIQGDINKVTTALFENLKQTDAPGFQKFTLLVPTDAYAAIATTPRSDFSDMTILQYALKNNPWVEAIEPWRHCNTAGDMGSGRLVAYPRNPLALGGIVPSDFKALAPQERNQDIVVPVSAKCGGVICRYPVAVLYMDHI